MTHTKRNALLAGLLTVGIVAAVGGVTRTAQLIQAALVSDCGQMQAPACMGTCPAGYLCKAYTGITTLFSGARCGCFMNAITTNNVGAPTMSSPAVTNTNTSFYASTSAQTTSSSSSSSSSIGFTTTSAWAWSYASTISLASSPFLSSSITNTSSSKTSATTSLPGTACAGTVPACGGTCANTSLKCQAVAVSGTEAKCLCVDPPDFFIFTPQFELRHTKNPTLDIYVCFGHQLATTSYAPVVRMQITHQETGGVKIVEKRVTLPARVNGIQSHDCIHDVRPAIPGTYSVTAEINPAPEFGEEVTSNNTSKTAGTIKYSDLIIYKYGFAPPIIKRAGEPWETESYVREDMDPFSDLDTPKITARARVFTLQADGQLGTSIAQKLYTIPVPLPSQGAGFTTKSTDFPPLPEGKYGVEICLNPDKQDFPEPDYSNNCRIEEILITLPDITIKDLWVTNNPANAAAPFINVEIASANGTSLPASTVYLRLSYLMNISQTVGFPLLGEAGEATLQVPAIEQDKTAVVQVAINNMGLLSGNVRYDTEYWLDAFADQITYWSPRGAILETDDKTNNKQHKKFNIAKP